MSNHHPHPHYTHRSAPSQSSVGMVLPNNNAGNPSNTSSTPINTNNSNTIPTSNNNQQNTSTNANNNNNIPLNPNHPNGTTSRIPELLECVKQEFENIQAESLQLKNQTQELESHISTCTADLNHLRDQLYHLDREHQRLKSHYEEELRRLHAELEQRSSAAGPLLHPHHDHRGPPSLPQSTITGPPGSMNQFGPIVNTNQPNAQQQQHNLNGPAGGFHHDPPPNFPPRDCEPPSNYSNGNHNAAPGGRNSTDNNLSIPEHPSKRLRSDRDARAMAENELDQQQLRQPGPPPPISGPHNPPPGGMAGSPVLPHPPGRQSESKNKLKTNDSQYSKIPNQNTSHPYGTSYHPRADSHIQPPPPAPAHHHHHPVSNLSSGPGGGQITTSQSGSLQQQPSSAVNPNNTNNNTNVLLDLDPDTLPIHMKKEGPDWMTMFNPKVPKVLDVGLIHTLVHDSVVCCVKFSPDGTILATGCNRFTSLYNTLTGEKMCSLLDDTHGNKGADNYIRSASFSPDGNLLATGSEDRIIRIWDVSQRRIVKRFQGHKSEIYSLAFSPDGRILVSGSGDKTARIWDMTQGICLFHLLIDETSASGDSAPVDAGVTSVCVSPDGTLLAAGSLDTIVRLWDTSNGLLLDKLKGHKDSVYSVAFSPDGKFLVSGSLDKTLKLWDLSTLNRDGNPPFNSSLSLVNIKKEDQSSGSSSVPASSGGNVGPGAAVSHHQPVVERGENGEKVTSDRGFDPSRPSTLCTTTLTGHKDYVLSVAVSPDGEWIMSGSKDRGVQFWDPKTAMAQFMLQGHKNSVISIAVSETGGLLATGSGDWHARIWTYKRISPKK